MKKILTLFTWTILSFSFVFAQSNNKVVTATPIDTIDVVCHDLELRNGSQAYRYAKADSSSISKQ